MGRNFDILSETVKNTEEFLRGYQMPKFRARQIIDWIRNKGIDSYHEMSNISKSDREILSEIAKFYIPKIIDTKISKDKSRKFVLMLEDGKTIESVVIYAEKRITLCVSSQVGCRWHCSFCLTGVDQLDRNMTAAEIVGSIVAIRRIKDIGNITNIVFMGMGEPLDNYDNLVKALHAITDETSGIIGKRKITVSTAGISDKIERIGNDFPEIQLAISINAATDEKRAKLMPITKKYPLKTVIDAANSLKLPKGRHLTFEYVLIKDINDSIDDAKELVRLISKTKAAINLIPYNRSDYLKFEPSKEETIKAFQQFLISKNKIATIREPKGEDISAACGLLKRERKTD